MKNNKVIFNPTNILSENEFEENATKVRITTFIDIDVLKSLKKNARLKNTKYQTLLNEILRKNLFNDHNIEDDIKNILKRLERVEKKVS